MKLTVVCVTTSPPVNRGALVRCCVFYLSAAQVGAVDCSGNGERFCVRQGVQAFPAVMVAIDGKTTEFDGNLGAWRVCVLFSRTVADLVCLCFHV